MDIKQKILALAVMAVPLLTAVKAITLDNLTLLGQELGGFFQGLGSGLGEFLLLMAIIGGISSMMYGLFLWIKGSIRMDR